MTPEEVAAVRSGEALHAAAARLRSTGAAIGAAGDDVRSVAARELAGDAWLGVAAAAAHRAHARPATGLDALAGALRQAAAVVDRLGTDVTEAGRRQAALAQQLQAAWSAAPLGPGLATVKARLADARAAQHCDDLAAARSLQGLAAELRRLAAGWGPTDLVDPVQGLLLRAAGTLGSVPTQASEAAARLRVLVAGGDPVQIRAYATALSPTVRDKLAAGFPDLVGPVDGLPLKMRYAANRRLLARAEADAGRRGDYAMAARLAGWLDAACRQFLLVDIPGGRIAEVIGDLDTAAHVGVTVPGISNTLADFDDLSDSAVNLYRQTEQLAAGGVAMISWLGYRTPDLLHAPLDDIAVANADRLRDLIAGLVLRRGVTTTVVAHSYGSLLAGLALRGGLRVDAVAVLGSPGMGTRTAADLHLPTGTRLYAARAPLDYVSWTEAFGRDPSDPRFGATRIQTGRSGAGGPSGHTSYLAGVSEATRNLARIISGRYAEVTKKKSPADERITSQLDLPRRAAEALAELPTHGTLPPAYEAVQQAYEADARLSLVLSRLASLDLLSEVSNDLEEYEEEHW